MQRTLLAFAILIISPGWAAGQDVKPATQQTTPPANARFEILQSSLSSRFIYRLDRFSGQISRGVTSRTIDEITWEEMTIDGLPAISDPAAPRFQMSLSGTDYNLSFLLDTETGTIWHLVLETQTSPDGAESVVSKWQPFPE